MKTIFLTSAICFILTLAASGQTKLPKGFEMDYDKFKDETEISFDDGLSPKFIGWFQHSGQSLKKDIDEFNFTFMGSRQRCTGYCFKNDPGLIFLIDGERVKTPEIENFLGDTITFQIGRAMVAKIAAAKEVQFQVGPFEGTWKDKTLAKFKTLLDLGTAK